MHHKAFLRTGISSILIAGAVIAATSGATNAPTPQAAARFLTQASWAPNAVSIADIQKYGFETWIDRQMDPSITPPSVIPLYSTDAKGNTSLRPVQNAFFSSAVSGQDQLRQRVAFALSQIWVVSGVKLKAEAMQPYVKLLQADAFATYPKIMYDVTVSPAMGHYLDMVNNDKPTPGHGADENYAREILQLFTIGLNQLDQKGNVVIDSNTKLPIPTYDQTTIEGFANVFTGWTYAPQAGKTSRFPNPANWNTPMVPFDDHHDTSPKTVLNGVTIANGNGPGVAVKDLNDALANIFDHPNVAPFISRQLIQHLVESQPTPEYVGRVAQVLHDSKGDMPLVIKAILLDTEARQGDSPSDTPINGHLREPVLFINALLRNLNGTVDSTTNSLTDYATLQGQTLYYSPTVFNYFPPGYTIQVDSWRLSQNFNAPEFGLLGGATTLVRANFVNSLVYGRIGGVTLDLTPYLTLLGTNPGAAQIESLLQALNAALLGGRMSQELHDTMLPAVQKAATPKAMVQAAIYLIASSWEFQVER